MGLHETELPEPIRKEGKATKKNEFPSQKKSRHPFRRSDYFWGYLLIAPTFLGLLGFYIWPGLQTIYFSFTTWGDFGTYEWSGLSNYIELFRNPGLSSALKNSFLFAALSVPLSISISIVLAVLLNQKIKGMSFYRTMYFIPVITIPAAVAMVWKWLYNADYGLINYILALFGINGPNWLTNPNFALLSIVLVSVWMQVGYYMIFFLSGLQGIPSSLYEAASIDGAGPLRKFFTITLPMLTPTTFFVTIISLIDALQVFDLIFMMMDQTNPAASDTRTLVILFFREAFELNNKGFASAIAVLVFLIIFTITLIQVKLQKKWVHYE